MINGARQGALSGLRRLVASAMARDLTAFVIPGPDIARAHGLDIEAAGLQPVASPRHASVLLVIGTLSPALREAAAVIYAQMVRPRALFVLGTDAVSPLPAADVTAGLSRQGLIEGVHQLRLAFARGAFRPDVSDFDAAVLQVSIEYTCPMHPEVVADEPGSCPKCGMNLVPREAQASAGHVHPAPQQTDTREHTMPQGMDHGAAVEYTCPMHPEVVQSEPGSCPKCGMDLEPRSMEDTHDPGYAGMSSDSAHAGMDHSTMDHGDMDHGDMAFMSMFDVTKDLPRSGDGLPMEWIDAPFGPFFPGLPGGLLLTLTLDGDTVAGSGSHSLTGNAELLRQVPMDTAGFVERLAGMDPLAPVAYRLLACRALEDAAGVDLSPGDTRARVGALERERIASHLGWLTLFGQQTGFDWLMQHAAALQLVIQQADLQQIMAQGPALHSLVKRLLRTPLLKSRTAGIGQLTSDAVLRGPVARACGISDDARSADPGFTTLGFTPAHHKEGDALARLHIRLDEITHSLALIEAAGTIEPPATATVGAVSASGEAVVETPRGRARLQLTLESGQVTAAQLQTPSTPHLGLIESLTAQQALGDALVAVGSLDLSPWEIQP